MARLGVWHAAGGESSGTRISARGLVVLRSRSYPVALPSRVFTQRKESMRSYGDGGTKAHSRSAQNLRPWNGASVHQQVNGRSRRGVATRRSTGHHQQSRGLRLDVA